MDWAEIIQDIMCPLAVLGAWAVCFIIRQITDKCDKFIPLIAALVGVLIVVWIEGWTISAETIVMGLISGLAATGIYELISNLITKED